MSDTVQGPLTELETQRFIKHGTPPKLDDMTKEQHRLQAHTADLWAKHYSIKAAEADWMEEREFWLKREAHYRLECQLHLSILEGEMENV